MRNEMDGLLGDFQWRVPQRGFRFMRGAHRKPHARFTRGGIAYLSGDGQIDNDLAFLRNPTEFLVPVLKDGERLPYGLVHREAKDALPLVLSGSDSRTYRPLQETPTLFREFSQSRPTSESILDFANKWGGLGSEGTCELTPETNARKGKPASNIVVWGEVAHIWDLESGDMHDAVALWDAIKQNDQKLLRETIWIEDGVNWHSVPDGWAFVGQDYVAATDHHAERLPIIEKHGLKRAALYIVQDLVNEGLRGRVREMLDWDEDGKALSVRIVPINLIGAMWLQLANAIGADKDYQRCPECASWFETAPGSARPDKLYCSNACRMRAYRKRKNTKPRRHK